MAGGSGSGGVAADDGGSCTIDPRFTGATCRPCTVCLQPFCCTQINNCYADSGCAQIMTCTSNCYSGMAIDGGMFDAGDTNASDACAAACMANTSTASQALFTSQDNCQNEGLALTMCNGATGPCQCP